MEGPVIWRSPRRGMDVKSAGLVYSRNRSCQKKRVVMAARRKEEGGRRLRLTARGNAKRCHEEGGGKAKRRGAMGEGGAVRKRKDWRGDVPRA